MICILPSWASHGLTLALLALAVGSGYFAFLSLSRVGARRYPRMDFDDSHRRRWWESCGMALGFFVFVVVGVVAGESLRPLACELVGTYQPPPNYSLP